MSGVSGRREIVGIFGGSFDPPHYGHVLCCVYAKLAFELDRVLILPAGRHAFGKRLTPATDRLEMIRLAFGDLPFCEPCLVEIERAEREPARPSYMVDSLREIAALLPDASLRLIVGTDLKRDLAKWKEADEVARLAPPAWVPRGAMGGAGEHSGFALPDWSSTAARSSLAQGGDVSAILPAAVRRYANDRKLYG